MTSAGTAQTQHRQQVPDAIVRVGGWLFKRRTALPLPIAVILLLARPAPGRPYLIWTGAALAVTGELVRLFAVRHIGVISRTRSDRLGPLVASGPFGRVRNPLYIGNMLIWIGFTISARLLPLLGPIAALLFVEYHAIVRWEEKLLESRLGDAYRDYLSKVPRWIPRSRPSSHGYARTESDGRVRLFSWRETFFSERGTLVAIAAGYLALWVKALLLNR
jgi:protein-S-isoprenylcysteine O-methyltransferase Ste14